MLLNKSSYLEKIEFFITNNESNFLVNYMYWNEPYSYIFYYVCISFLVCCLLFLVAFILTPKEVTFEKTSSYECGFEPFGESHSIFSIQFFIVGILFMIFDLELAFVFPWVINLGNLSIFSFFIMIIFLILLTIGFVYEWKKGALDWI